MSLHLLFRSYYINHYTKTTSWEDPRERYKEIGKPTGKDNKENEVTDIGFPSFVDLLKYFLKRWFPFLTYKWQACEGSLKPNSLA